MPYIDKINLYGTIYDIQDQLATDRLDVVDTTLAEHKTSIDTNASNIQANSEKIASNKADIDTIKTEQKTQDQLIATNTSNIAINKTAIDNTNKDVSALKTKVENFTHWNITYDSDNEMLTFEVEAN